MGRLSKKLRVATSWEANWVATCSSFKEIFSASVNNVGSKVDIIFSIVLKILPRLRMLLPELNFRKKSYVVCTSIVTNKSTSIESGTCSQTSKISAVKY